MQLQVEMQQPLMLYMHFIAVPMDVHPKCQTLMSNPFCRLLRLSLCLPLHPRRPLGAGPLQALPLGLVLDSPSLQVQLYIIHHLMTVYAQFVKSWYIFHNTCIKLTWQTHRNEQVGWQNSMSRPVLDAHVNLRCAHMCQVSISSKMLLNLVHKRNACIYVCPSICTLNPEP